MNVLLLAGLYWATITAPCQVDPFVAKVNDQVVVGYAFTAQNGGETLLLVSANAPPSGPGVTYHGAESGIDPGDGHRIIVQALYDKIIEEAERLQVTPGWDPRSFEAGAP